MIINSFPQGKNVPSSRFRLESYLPYLKKRKLFLILYPLSAYPPDKILNRPLWFVKELVHRIKQIKLKKEGIILQEIISTIPTLEFSQITIYI